MKSLLQFASALLILTAVAGFAAGCGDATAHNGADLDGAGHEGHDHDGSDHGHDHDGEGHEHGDEETVGHQPGQWHAGDPEAKSVMASYDPANPAATLAALNKGDANSKLDFEVRHRDLGSVRQRNQYPVEFPFTINGDDDVTVTSLAPSCGCTDPRLMVEGEPWPLNKPIPAGAKGKVVATFDSKTFIREKSTKVTVLSNAKNRRDYVSLKAFVLPTFEIQPVQVRLGQVTHGDVATKEVKVSGIEDFTVSEWTKVPEGLSIEAMDRVEPGTDGMAQARYYRISVSPEARTGQLYGSFIGQTTLGDPIEIFVTGAIVGRIRFLPEHRLSFGLVNKGDSPERVIRVLATKPGESLPEPDVSLLKNDEGLFSYTITAHPGGGGYEIRTKLSDNAPAGRHDAKIKIGFGGEYASESKEMSVTAIIR